MKYTERRLGNQCPMKTQCAIPNSLSISNPFSYSVAMSMLPPYASALSSPRIGSAVIITIIRSLMMALMAALMASMPSIMASPSLVVFIGPLLRIPIISRLFSPLRFKLSESLSRHKLLRLPVEHQVRWDSH
jgi:hypothetical protein